MFSPDYVMEMFVPKPTWLPSQDRLVLPLAGIFWQDGSGRIAGFVSGLRKDSLFSRAFEVGSQPLLFTSTKVGILSVNPCNHIYLFTQS